MVRSPRLRAVGLPRASLALGIAIATGVFFYMGVEGNSGAAAGGIFLEALLIGFVQQGIEWRERRLFLVAAVVLGFAALATGLAVGGGGAHHER
jgi:hypothetical protein